MLLVDLRGTGLSGALDCPALRKTVADYVRRAGRCARQIGPRRDLYGTHAAANDVAAVLDALRVPRVDLYGDSYGSYFGQVFAARHGDRLRSLVLLQSGYANVPMYRDLLAAIRAFERGDRAPLLRLFAENRLDTSGSPPRGFSEALYLAVTCHDYPQLWDPAAGPADRRDQLARAVAALPPERFAPTSPAVWTGLDYEGATACLRWPGLRRPDPPASYPAVPTLVLNGDLDNITASSGARVVASRFPAATFVETANTVHISALGDRDDCAAPLVRFRFRRTRFTRDVAVSGRATWRLSDGAVRAELHLPGRGRLRARWSAQRPLAVATLDGTLGGRRLRASMLAP